jgi:hypothetical protein
MAEREILGDAIHVRGMHGGGAPEIAAALGVFGLRQMAFPSAGTQDFSAGSDFESLGHGLLRFNTFWTSHKSEFLSKRARNIESAVGQCKCLFGLFDYLQRNLCPQFLELLWKHAVVHRALNSQPLTSSFLD